MIVVQQNKSLIVIDDVQQAPIILLKEGTDTSQGKPQLISNINACQAIVDAVRTTLGPRGMDKLIVDASGCDLKCEMTVLNAIITVTCYGPHMNKRTLLQRHFLVLKSRKNAQNRIVLE